MADLSCPICLDVLKDPFVTPCGHSFCYNCVTAHLQNKNTCPSCSDYLTRDKIFPNHLLSQIAAVHAKDTQAAKSSLTDQLQDAIQSDEDSLKLGDVELLLSALEDKRQDLQQKEKERRLELLLHFLQNSRLNKSERLSDLQDELSVLSKDIDQVLQRKALPGYQSVLPQFSLQNGLPESQNSELGRHIQNAFLGNGIASGTAGRSSRRNPSLTEARAGQDRGLPISNGLQPLDRHMAPAHSRDDHLGGLASAHGRLLQTSGEPAERPLPSNRGQAQPLQERYREPSGRAPNVPEVTHDRNVAVSTDLGTRQATHANGHLSGDALFSAFQPTGFPDVQMAENRAAAASAFLRVPSVTHDLALGQAGLNEDPLQWLMRSRSQADLDGVGITNGLPEIAQARHRSSGARDQARETTTRRRTGHENVSNQPSDRINGVMHEDFTTTDATETSGVTSSHMTDAENAEHATSTFTRNSSDRRNNAETCSTSSAKRGTESHFEDLQKQYFKMRKKQLETVKRRRLAGPPHEEADADQTPFRNGLVGDLLRPDSLSQPPAGREDSSWQGANGSEGAGDSASAFIGLEKSQMREFSRTLSLYMKNTKLEVLASISASTPRNSAAILSGVAFNLDCKMFASAGVSKRVALYDTQAVLDEASQSSHKEVSNRPVAELMTPSKLSCISWNRFHESHLLSSDYEGVITLWDTQSQQSVAEFEAHQKRIWSVDFCPANSHSLVSASDDGFVKLWSTRQQQCIGEINMHANVCCAQFNPHNEHEISAGCADHRVHIFDLRQPQRPVQSFAGHGKSVSYVRYMSPTSLVSASTDSTLRAWSRQESSVVRTYTGHLNSKNFVGLAADNDFIATGSETSEVVVYYKSMSRPVARSLFKHPAAPQSSGSNSWRSGPAFISALCWQPRTEDRILLAGSSHGTLKILKLVTNK